MENKKYKVLVEEEGGNDDEIKRVIHLLDEKTSNKLAILEDLEKLMSETTENKENLVSLFLKMGFLESAAKIFENENDYDEHFTNILVTIIKKIDNIKNQVQGTGLLQSDDAIDSLFNIFGNYSEGKICEGARKALIAILKNHPSDALDSEEMSDFYQPVIYLKCNFFSEQNKNIYLFFKELINLKIINEGKEGSSIIEELLFLEEEMEYYKDIIDMSEDFYNSLKDFVRVAKEQGFKKDNLLDKNTVISNFIYIVWKELCKESDCCSGKEDKEDKVDEKDIKEEEKEKLKKFCMKISSKNYECQSGFVSKMSVITEHRDEFEDDFSCFKGRKNGFFLQIFLPLFLKYPYFDWNYLSFFGAIRKNHDSITPCYNYLRKANDEIYANLLKELKEGIEINGGKIKLIMFLWCFKKEETMTEKDLENLIILTLKVLEWLGRIEEENEEEDENNNAEDLEDEDEKENDKFLGGKMNERGSIAKESVEYISDCFFFNHEKEKDFIQKDGRIGRLLLEILKKHMLCIRNLIHSDNKTRALNYIYNSIGKPSFRSFLYGKVKKSYPFSVNYIAELLSRIQKFFSDDDNKELLKKDYLKIIVDWLENSVDIINLVNNYEVIESDKEINMLPKYKKWINIKESMSFGYLYLQFKLFSILDSEDLSSFDNENNKIVKRMINLYFSHSNNYIYSNWKEKEKNEKSEELTLFHPFMVDRKGRESFCCNFLNGFVDYAHFSIFDVFYLIKKSEEGCNIISFYLKELSGEIIDRIKKREGINGMKERRKYERELYDGIYSLIAEQFENLLLFIHLSKKKVYIGDGRKKDNFEGKEEKIKVIKDYLSDIIEEEDMRECFILFLKHTDIEIDDNDEKRIVLSSISSFFKFPLKCLLCP